MTYRSRGVSSRDHLAVFLTAYSAELRSHESAEARVFALDLYHERVGQRVKV
jgi:hypothetical protein